MKTRCLLPLCTLLPLAPVLAQTAFHAGLVAGFAATGAYNGQSSQAGRRYRPGFEAGLQGVLQRGHWGVQPSLRYAQQGYRSSAGVSTVPVGSPPTSSEAAYRYHYLTLPLTLAYSLRADGQGLQVTAGPYAGLLLGGNYSISFMYGAYPAATQAGQVRPGDEQPYPSADLYQRALDLGLQAGLGYRWGGLLAQATWSMGLRNLTVLDYIYQNTYNRAAQFSLSYLFGTPSRKLNGGGQSHAEGLAFATRGKGTPTN